MLARRLVIWRLPEGDPAIAELKSFPPRSTSTIAIAEIVDSTVADWQLAPMITSRESDEKLLDLRGCRLI